MHTILKTIALCYLVALSSALWISPANLDQDLLSSYDYIIIGGGISGVVVANRLTEDPNSKHLLPQCAMYQ
jgi:choline dehydrogenase